MNENEVTRVNYRNKLNSSRLFNMLNWYEFNVFQDMSSSDMYCGCIPADTHESFVEMLSFSLLKDPVFVLFVVSNFATSLGFYVPYFCLADRMKVLGMRSEEASYLLSSIGVANTLGRIILGFISDKSWVNRLWVYNVCLMICGVGKSRKTASEFERKLIRILSLFYSHYNFCVFRRLLFIIRVRDCVRIYNWGICWIDVGHFGGFAWIGETYKCIRIVAIIPRYRDIRWTTNCWLPLR